MSHHKYSHILHEVYETPWMIRSESLELIASIVERKIAGVELSEDELLEISGGRNTSVELSLPETPSVAVLPIHGSIIPKANLMTKMSGGTTVEQLKKDFNALMASDMVTGIVLDINSPGGHASMIKEMADVIYSARGTKPITAVANPMCCSAAYYLGSQADSLFGTPSGMIGSVGVVAMHVDTSAQDTKDGIVRTILTAGKYKAEANPYQPLSDEAKAFKLEQMDELYNEFVGDVARGRGLDSETVLADFGQGRAYRPATALKRGMIDGIKTLDAVTSDMASEAPFSVSMHFNSATDKVMPENERKGKMAEVTPETLEFLGLTEDATSEDIEKAIKAIKTATPEITEEDDFASLFPEQAAEIARLRETDRKNAAKMFASEYAQFSSGKGFSSLGIDMVESLHLKVADGIITQTDLKEFLDFVASDNAVVDYKEHGSTQGVDVTEGNGQAAAVRLRDLAYEKVASDGLSYGDALSKVMEENPILAKEYRGSVASPVERGEG